MERLIFKWLGLLLSIIPCLLTACAGTGKDCNHHSTSMLESSKAASKLDGKFIQTFMVKLRNTRLYPLKPGDEQVLSKFDMLMFTRNWYDTINGHTWCSIRQLNPSTEVYIQTEGPTIWKQTEKEKSLKWLKGISRYDNGRGHSMGAINADHPEFFLLKADGTRCRAYKSNYKDRFLMDFGNPGYQTYWIEAIKNDVLQQPWRAQGIHIDNTGPLPTFQTEMPAKYDTDAKWSQAALSFVDAITRSVHADGTKVWINAGGTATEEGWKALLQLDDLDNPPDVIGEEGAFCHSWGRKATTFISEEKWKRSVDFLSKIKNSRQAYFSHTKLVRDKEAFDNFGKPVTYWQSLWYALGSYLLGKDDKLGNAYFFFFSKGEGGYAANNWWFDEYERIDLGKAAGSYEISVHGGSNVYRREFEKGFVIVNPTENDVVGLKLPACRQLTHENMKHPPGTLPIIEEIDLNAHHAAILLKVN